MKLIYFNVHKQVLASVVHPHPLKKQGWPVLYYSNLQVGTAVKRLGPFTRVGAPPILLVAISQGLPLCHSDMWKRKVKKCNLSKAQCSQI